MPKTNPTASVVSRLLASAGFKRASLERRGAPGFHARTEGPRVIVSWRPEASLLAPLPGQGKRDKATAVEMAGKYARTLERAGYTAKVDVSTVYVLAAEAAQTAGTES